MGAHDARATSTLAAPRKSAGRIALPHALAERLEALAEAEREQLPLWLPVGLGAGIAAWFALHGSTAWTAFLLAALGAAGAFLAVAAGTRWGRALAIFTATAALGCGLIWLKSECVAAPRLDRAQVMEFQATILEVEPLPARESVRLLLRTSDPALPSKVRVNVDEEDARPEFVPGATIALRARLMPPAPMAIPGAYDFARVAWFEGLGATGRALDPPVLVAPAGQGTWSDRLARWRHDLSAHIRSRIGDDGAGAIAAAFATGDQGAMPEGDAEAMRRSGLAHLLSISGLHVAAVVGAAMLLTIRLLALSPMMALRWPLVLIGAGAGAAVGLAYTLFTGSEVPTIRACVAAMIVLAGIALGRDAITLRLVAVGALVVLLFWPEALAGPSFQLSFAAVTAIVALHEHRRIKALLSRREEGPVIRFGRILLGLLLTGLAVEIALAPIALYHFHRAGLYGAFANIVAIPLTTFIVMPLEAVALMLDVAGLGAPVWWLVGKSLELLLALAHATAEAPGAVAMLPTMPRYAFALMVAGGLWLMLWRTRWRRWGLVPLAIGAIVAATTPAPDLIVTGDGRHLALRTADGGTAILRGRAGDYIRDLLSEGSGTDVEMPAVEDVPGAACSADLCAVDLVQGERRWRLLATRSRHFVGWRDMVHACAAADIVVADRRLPEACKPRWLKADRAFLARTGGIAVTLGKRPRVATVADRTAGHPWAIMD